MNALFASRNVASISSVCTGELQQEIYMSDCIRNETLKRMYQIPSMQYKTLAWKNRYYDYFKTKITKEINSSYEKR